MFNFSSEGGVPLLQSHLVRYPNFAITPRKMHRLGSFFNMMRISSSATNSIIGVFFVQPFSRNWPGNLTPVSPL